MKGFYLGKVGEVSSSGNPEIAQLKEKGFDLQQAFATGVRPAEV